jgi:hypothetical protein
MLPGAGMPQAFGQGGATPSYAPTTPATQAQPSWQSNGGGLGVGGGLLGMAMSAASGAGNMIAPGAGAAAQMGLEAINKTIAFGGKAAAIGVQGLMDTFAVSDPDGGGSGAQSSWATRILGGLASVRPAGDMNAGKKDDKSKVDPNAQQQGQLGQQAGQNITNNIHLAPDRQNGQKMANEITYMQALNQ